jgi:hypothetical protein
MISLIIVFYNYFVWLFTGTIPMEHINKDLAPLNLCFLGSLEFLIEIGLIGLIINLLAYISFRKKDN